MTDDDFLHIRNTQPHTRVYVSVGGYVYSDIIGHLEVKYSLPGNRITVLHAWENASGALYSFNLVADIFLTSREAKEHEVLSKLAGCNW